MILGRGLFDLLACPVCRNPVDARGERLHCAGCRRSYPIVNGVPVLFPDGSVPSIQHEQETNVAVSYYPWVHRVTMQSLLDDQVVLNLGSGNMSLDDPCIIRMDVHLTPHVDVVGDAHALPFLPGVFDFVLSLAVFEHLRQPFVAAEEIRRVLKDGGYAYHECNFVYAYHGYPHHYFNSSVQGLEEIFGAFRRLRTGVAPYQMPSFAIQMLLYTYLRHSTMGLKVEALPLFHLLERIYQEDLASYDRYFTEADAAYVAAGCFYYGLKQDRPDASVIPPPLWHAWEGVPGLKERFPEPRNLGTIDNLLRWAREEKAPPPEVTHYLAALPPFHKRGVGAPFDRTWMRAMPFIEPRFGTIYDYPGNTPRARTTARWRRSLQARLRHYANLLEPPIPPPSHG